MLESTSTQSPKTSTTLADEVLARVNALVRDELSRTIAAAGQLQPPLGLHVDIVHTASFNPETIKGPGPLESGDSERTTVADMESLVRTRTAEAVAHADALLRQWADRNPDYRARPEPSDCLPRPPQLYAEFTCEKCHGNGSLTCSECNGRKKLTCMMCEGKGKDTCPSCYGQVRVQCSACRGTKRVDERTCGICNGVGSGICGRCDNGKVKCEKCKAAGTVPCSRCHATGSVTCFDCGGTGVCHHLVLILCTLARETAVRVDSQNLEDQQTLAAAGRFDGLGALAPLARDSVRSANGRLTLSFTSTVAVETLSLARGARHTQVRGYGGAHRVFNYQSVVEDLLASDLTAFEMIVAQRLRAFGAGLSGLADSTRQFLASELNALIATRQGRHRSSSEKADAADPMDPLIEENLVSGAYVQRAEAALGKALPHLHTALILPTTLIVLAALVVGVLIAIYEPLTPWSARTKVLMLLLATGIAWFVVEFRVPAKLRAMLGAALYARLEPRFAQVRRRSWLAAAASLAAAALLAIVL